MGFLDNALRNLSRTLIRWQTHRISRAVRHGSKQSKYRLVKCYECGRRHRSTRFKECLVCKGWHCPNQKNPCQKKKRRRNK